MTVREGTMSSGRTRGKAARADTSSPRGALAAPPSQTTPAPANKVTELGKAFEKTSVFRPGITAT